MNIQESIDDTKRFLEKAEELRRATQDITTLELLRGQCDDDAERRLIDWVVLKEKRELKAVWESYDRLADLFDKASLPVAAAVPGFVALLTSEQLLVDPLRQKVALVSYIVGAGLWVVLRLAAMLAGRKSKAGMARLGKVD